MKNIKNIIIVVIIVLTSICLLFINSGYQMYRKAIKEVGLTEKVSQITEKENYTKLSEMPKIYLDAVIAVEDHRFYNHNGIDVISIGRAAFNDIRTLSFIEGGSTITQQLSKNVYFTQKRKLREKLQKFLWLLHLKNTIQKTKYLNCI